MKKRGCRDFLNDIIDAINDVKSFIDDLSYDEFVKDRKTLSAVIRSIEVIAEATKNYPTKLKKNAKICLGIGWLA